MAALNIEFPVCCLDGYKLVGAGTVLPEDMLSAIIQDAPPPDNTPYPLLRHAQVEYDVGNILDEPPYDVIFGPGTKADKVRRLLRQTHVPSCTLRLLDHFHEHDPYTYRHSLAVFALTLMLAQDLLPPGAAMLQELNVGPAHDFGKICIPPDVLRKPDGVTREERRLLDHHAVAGYVLLAYELQDLRGLTARVARDHHERKDGSGYPSEKHLSDQLVEIVAACDVYDALISPRPYRPTSYDNRTAIEVVTEMAGQGKMSWDIVQALVACNRATKPCFQDCVVSLEKRGVAPVDNRYGVLDG